MSEATVERLLIALLVVCVGLLVYLDWLRQGELEYVHERLDKLGGGGRTEAGGYVSGGVAPGSGPQTEATRSSAAENGSGERSVVSRLLGAHDDMTLEEIARRNV